VKALVRGEWDEAPGEEVKPSQNLGVSAWIRLLKAHNLVLREVRSKLKGYCTLSQLDVLAHLAREKDGATLAELSRHLLVTAGNITGLIDRMERSGYVKRFPDPEDRRVTRVQLTGSGKSLAETVLPKHAEDIEAVFGSLSDSEKIELRQLLDKFLAGFQNDRAE
jgi:DNA-binding MarR family transcriptional regulator